jgi:hypothetical protein
LLTGHGISAPQAQRETGDAGGVGRSAEHL